MGPLMAEADKPRTKAEILKLLKEQGDEFSGWLETVPDDFLGESITMPPGGHPASRTRFDILLAVKEHEMHHRGQLMLVERMLGLTPHLTRAQQERMAAMQAQAKA
jgi:uncharacterized damage-inducible protein DinB